MNLWGTLATCPTTSLTVSSCGESYVGDLKNPRWIYLKGFLFLLILIASATLILVENFNLRQMLLVGLVVWSAARLYYFMFYVIEKYVDPHYRFAGIGSFLIYVCRRRGTVKGDGHSEERDRARQQDPEAMPPGRGKT